MKKTIEELELYKKAFAMLCYWLGDIEGCPLEFPMILGQKPDVEEFAKEWRCAGKCDQTDCSFCWGRYFLLRAAKEDEKDSACLDEIKIGEIRIKKNKNGFEVKG